MTKCGSLKNYFFPLWRIKYLDATHIFDGLDTFPTHVAHMRDGAFVAPPSVWNPKQPLQEDSQASAVCAGSHLHTLALSWLREDRELRLAEEKSGKRMARGPKASDVSLKSGVRVGGGVLTVLQVVTDSEAFYKKYDYSH
jgi:CCR4-NOT complex subunit CAF16